MGQKRGQISTEYLIIISFVTFIVLTALGVAMFYSTQIRDSIKMSQIESFSKKIISKSERVFYAGEPSRATFTTYLPEGVSNITIEGYYIVFTIQTSSGTAVTAFPSNVNLTGTLTTNAGLKKISVNATSANVIIVG